MSSNIIIVGGGLAGLFCALKLAPRPVTLLTCAGLGEGSSSSWAQGGIAAAIGEGDSPESHLSDTIQAGAGIVDREIARLIAKEAGSRINDLLEYGVPFDRDPEGRLALSREAAHSARRIVRVRGDLAGRKIMDALIHAVQRTPSIRVLEGYRLDELILEHGKVVGVVARDLAKPLTCLSFRAAATVLATGGIGHLYAVTTNPAEANGDGLAAAAQAGAVIADAEFVQFHPTAIDIGQDPAPLATEALRGDGAVLINRSGHRFMPAVHPNAELAPRDIVARAVFSEIAAGRGAFLDARKAVGARFASSFPTVHAACLSGGIDPAGEPIPVAPAAHYHMGGILTDARGRSTVPGLWACGEVASTGAHGANRLASNSLLEAVVFSARVAEDLASEVSPVPLADLAVPVTQTEPEHKASHAEIDEIRRAMSRDVGVVRDAAGLQDAVALFAGIERDTERPSALRSMAAVALLVSASALRRQESRGAQARSDFPDVDPAWARRSFITLEEARAVAVTVEPLRTRAYA